MRIAGVTHGAVVGGVSAPEMPTLSSSPSLSLSPMCTFCSLSSRNMAFPWGLNRPWSRSFFMEKIKGRKIFLRGLCPGSPQWCWWSHHWCVTRDSHRQTEGSARASSPFRCRDWAIDSVFKVSEFSVTCDILSHSFGGAREKQGRIEGGSC